MKSIEFSLHSLNKISILKEHGFIINKDIIIDTVNNPDIVSQGKSGRLISTKNLDENHVLRVIFEEHESKIIIITMYPARRIRYEKD